MEIREVDMTGASKSINIDSIIDIPRNSFDSLILNQASVPQELEMVSKCYGCSGSTFYSFTIFNNRLIETFKIRALITFPLLLIQHKNIYNILESHSNFPNDKFYFITTSVRFEYIEGADYKKINNIDNLGGGELVFQKKKLYYVPIRCFTILQTQKTFKNALSN